MIDSRNSIECLPSRGAFSEDVHPIEQGFVAGGSGDVTIVHGGASKRGRRGIPDLVQVGGGHANMFDRYTDHARDVMSRARYHAERLNHERIGTEHILLAVVEQGRSFAAHVLKLMNIDRARIRHEVEIIVESSPAKVASGDVPFTPRAKHALEFAGEEASRLGSNNICTAHVLLGLVNENDGITARVFRNLRITLEDVRVVVVDFADPERGGSSESWATVPRSRARRLEQIAKAASFGRSLTELAIQKRLDPALSRQALISRVVQVLSLRARNSVALLGPAGIGKATIAEGVAQEVVGSCGPKVFGDAPLIEIDIEALAETVPDERSLSVRIDELVAAASAVHAILFLRDLVPLFGDSEHDHSLRSLRNSILNGTLRCIGCTTVESYRKLMTTHPRLDSAMQALAVKPPDTLETVEILMHLRHRYGEHHRVKYTDQALEEIVDLTNLYQPDDHQPRKAIALMDDVGGFVVASEALQRPPSIVEIGVEIARLDGEKERSVVAKDFERAALLRDQADKLRETRDAALREWMERPRVDGKVDVVAVQRAFAQAHGRTVEEIVARGGLPTPASAGASDTGVPDYERFQIESVLRDREIKIARGSGFAMLPYRREFEEVFDTAIRPALENNAIRARRGDQIIEPGSILAQVWAEIRSAEVLIADVSTCNPNVIYELGLCHASRRCPILLVRDAKELPFSIQSLRYIQYECSEAGLSSLKDRLTTAVSQFLGAVRKSSSIGG